MQLKSIEKEKSLMLKGIKLFCWFNTWPRLQEGGREALCLDIRLLMP